MRNAITDVPGFLVGHASDFTGITGCTVVLCPGGAVGGVDVRGSASGTRELDALEPAHIVPRVHGIFLAGGSAFGLDAAAGVMRFLEERGIGFDVGLTRVPIVPGAILFDLRLGDHRARPDAAMAYRACEAASDGPVEEGSVGAGTGATVGKLLGPGRAMKGGVGTASVALPGGVIVGALAAVNAFGDVVDPQTGSPLAGLRDGSGRRLLGTAAEMKAGTVGRGYGGENTTLAVVATNARLGKVEATKLARMAQNGLARSIVPVHTTVDGDLVFALAAGEAQADLNLVGLAAVEVVAAAIVRAIKKARGLAGIPAWTDLFA